MAQPLVIVESPAKAKTIAGYLGDDYMVESSVGHIRDLPAKAAEVPAAYKKEKWASMGIDVDNGFKPLYVVSSRSKDQVKKLKALLKDASELVLATDEDREGEAIAWHLLEVLNPRVPVKRMVFHEITPEAIRRAIDNPRDLDRRLVDAQEARRLLDRLYGYEVSPVLWKKVRPRLSAGRVQSVATRIVVERERERMAFRSANYWSLTGTFTATGPDHAGEPPFTATLQELDGQRIATGGDFDQSGTLARHGAIHLDRGAAEGLAAELAGRSAEVRSREAKPYRRRPAAPFITSTYQQEASRKLRLSSAQAMRVAQGLYERGYITYMRTDSTTLSDSAVAAARAQIAERYGTEFLPDAARSYAKKVKNAQEAHEAIRPAGDTFRTPDQVSGELSPPELRVYQLIWQRTVASQMTDATGETVTLKLGVDSTGGRHAVFSTSGTVITHQGFLKVYVEGTDDGDEAEGAGTGGTPGAGGGSDDQRRLPPLQEGDAASLTDLEPAGHDTQPPRRYTEASLVEKLEELGVGRPSTYASIMGTIQARGYVWKKGSALVPSFLAFAVVTLLERHFPDLVDYAFTARMEDDLDNIASGTEAVVPWLSQFYFGADEEPGLRELVNERLGDIDARAVNSIPIGEDGDGIPIVARVGQYGPYLERGTLGAFVLEREVEHGHDWWRPATPSHLRLRRDAVGVWTGAEIVIVGRPGTADGNGQPGAVDAAAYDPTTDAWRPLAVSPWTGRPADAVWTGDGDRTVVVLGTAGDGAIYDPSADAWTLLPPEFVGRSGFRAGVWSGERVLGVGWDDGRLTVASFDPATGYAIAGADAEVALSSTATVSWTGREVLVGDGLGGWRYDPTADRWHELPPLDGFDGARPKTVVVVGVGGAVHAVAWFKRSSTVRVARLDGDTWSWPDGLAIDGDLDDVTVAGDDLLILVDDAPASCYRLAPRTDGLAPLEGFPAKSFSHFEVVATGDGLVVWGNRIETKAIPNDVAPDELTPERAAEIMAVPDVIELGPHPESGLPIYVRDGKFGPYIQLGEMPRKVTDDNKPKTSSLFSDMRMEDVTLEDAVELLAIPRVIGVDPGDGREIVAHNGPYGPYLRKEPEDEGKRPDTRSFENERDLLTMTLDEAVAMYAQPKRRRGQSPAGPLKELGVDPTTDLPVVVRSGQFGEYVTDGEVNASLTATDSVERIDITRASELLAMRRLKLEQDGEGPAKATKKSPAKKSAKKSSAKKSARRSSAKKSSAKKSARSS